MSSQANLPTLFRACMWDDGWEFEAPGVVYLPHRYRLYGEVNNTGGIDDLVADICDRIAAGEHPTDGGLDDECRWRHWGRRFAARRQAWHVEYNIAWITINGGLAWHIASRTETWGPKTLGKGGAPC